MFKHYNMHQILDYLRTYFREEWNPKLFASIGALLIISFAINYGIDFERLVIRQLTHPLRQFVFYFFFYGIPYTLSLAAYAHTMKKKQFLQQKGFYLLTLVCFILLSTYVTLHNLPSFVLNNTRSVLNSVPKEYHWYLARYASNLLPGIVLLFPLALYWSLKDRNTSNLYGFSSLHIDLKTYFGIIVLIAPIILAASFGSDFQAAYPRYKFGLPSSAWGTEENALIAVFEVCYGVDFVFVELFFRGFMVMAFARYLGSGAILPMVVVYAFIHFQKPMGEAIASIVGGLVLGVISYRTRSIYGGIILHLGVAYLMEIAGTLQRLIH